MRAILVCVEYGDLLGLTLPYNRHHFSEVMVVTTPSDHETMQVAAQYGAACHATDAFYHDGADFNKWKALEEGLDVFGRHGLMAIMDADILWPTSIPTEGYAHDAIYSPLRYILPEVSAVIPLENEWPRLRKYMDFEHAGYTQIFWAEDHHLPEPPWHPLNWRHAGGGDSAFQALWPANRRLRPLWRVVHLGVPGQNWTGRITARLDGSVSPEAGKRLEALQSYMRQRKAARNYEAEKLPYS